MRIILDKTLPIKITTNTYAHLIQDDKGDYRVSQEMFNRLSNERITIVDKTPLPITHIEVQVTFKDQNQNSDTIHG